MNMIKVGIYLATAGTALGAAGGILIREGKDLEDRARKRKQEDRAHSLECRKVALQERRNS